MPLFMSKGEEILDKGHPMYLFVISEVNAEAGSGGGAEDSENQGK